MKLKAALLAMTVISSTTLSAPKAQAAVTTPSIISNAVVTHSFDPSTGDLMLSISTQVSASNVYLTPLAAPIYNPKNKSQIIGQVSIQADITGTSYFINALIDVSVSKLAVKTGLGLLPNGLMIPVGGVGLSNWIDLPIQGSAAHLYLNLNSADRTAVAGLAFNVGGMKTGFPFAVLVPFQSGQVKGMAGAYTGMAKGKSGFSVFVDASSLYLN